MSMALKYNMKKKAKDHSKGVHKQVEGLDEPGTSKAGFENERANFKSGMAKQFQRGAYQSMANEHHEAAKDEHREKLSELKSMKKPHLYAEGGEVCHACGGKMMAEGGDVVDSVMKKRSGQVANDTGDGEAVDEMENQFDYLVSHGDESGEALLHQFVAEHNEHFTLAYITGRHRPSVLELVEK